ncbi:CdaR family transcriptional regulator [Cellulosilyticum sp. I15G10I2]|uniref:CdaR family transcriptional regulator n=1 Tax=Cellulosilyticum sp. I15G10I2 TaxID=1892843 RepID=UPI00085C808E|nr:sugar diacid recognition domain-containing protein [Cellulosilyticum sp. I15G10I2]
MLLQKGTCQKIVDRFINILDTNINIMDLNGNIIASTNKARVNTFHPGAHSCILNSSELIITEANQHLYTGCALGINLPIYYEDEVIGAVGITGDPQFIKGYTLIVKELVELIVAEDEHRKYIQLKEETKRSFFTQLFNELPSVQEEVLESRAHIADFNFSASKRIVLLEINTADQADKSSKTNFEKQKIKTKIRTYIKTTLQIHEDIIDLYEDEIILILHDHLHLEAFLSKTAKSLIDYYQVLPRFYISDLCNQLKDYAPNYKKTKTLATLYKGKAVYTSFLWVNNYHLELMLNTLSEGEKLFYLNTFHNLFSCPKKDQAYYDLLETVKSYFECNMSSSDTAVHMNLHRNTVRYRLNKFNDLYQIDITKPYECMKIYLAIKLFLD